MGTKCAVFNTRFHTRGREAKRSFEAVAAKSTFAKYTCLPLIIAAGVLLIWMRVTAYVGLRSVVAPSFKTVGQNVPRTRHSKDEGS